MIIIVGADQIGCRLAQQLLTAGQPTLLVDCHLGKARRARAAGLTVLAGDATRGHTLRRAQIMAAQALLATTSNDEINWQVCDRAQAVYGVREVGAWVQDEALLPRFYARGMRAVGASTAAAVLLDRLIRRPPALPVVGELVRDAVLAEVTITAPTLAQHSVLEIQTQFAVLVTGLRRHHQPLVPTADLRLHLQDRLTILGPAAQIHALHGANQPAAVLVL